MFIINKIIGGDPQSHDQHEPSVSYLYMKFLYERGGAGGPGGRIGRRDRAEGRKSGERGDGRGFFYEDEGGNIAMWKRKNWFMQTRKIRLNGGVE